MAPIIFAGAIAEAIGIAAGTFGSPDWTLVLVWAAVVIAVHALEIATLRRSQEGKGTDSETILKAVLRGALWGSVLLLVAPHNSDLHGIVLVAVGGMCCVIAVSMVNYAQAAIGFVISFAVFAAISLLRLDNVGDAINQAMLIGVCLAAFSWLAIRQGRLFVKYQAAQSQIHENGQIVNLLLTDGRAAGREWLWGVGDDGLINRVSPGLCSTTFLTPEQLMGIDFVEFLSCITARDDLVMLQLRRAVMQRQPFQDIEFQLVGPHDTSWWRLSGEPAYDLSGAYSGYVGTGSDITERRLSERRMAMLAHNDPLTGLYNRTKFNEVLNNCVARLERYGTPFALLYLDLDNFKLINDGHGHIAGDRLLVEIAKRIDSCIRDSDLSSRLGGDEFAVVLSEGCSPEACAALSARLIASISQPIDIDGETLDVGVSIGIAIGPINGTRPDQLQRNADLALYRAKQDGRSVFRFFETQMDAEARERRLLEMELRDALRNNELMLYYQPLVSAVDNATTGFEALMRWQHPIRGLIAPAEFIPIAEQSSLIVEIGDWTIREACRAAALWPEPLTVAVNLSAKHFRQSEITAVVKRAVEESHLTPGRLELEVTEGLLMASVDDVADKLHELQKMGVTIVMDDFGTGYSSLSYLLKFPFDKIKIDRSFVSASSKDPMARDILRAIASLGKTLNLSITAEGVETLEQAEFLSEIACHNLQGFYFARPLNATDMPAYLMNALSKSVKQVPASAAVQYEAKLA